MRDSTPATIARRGVFYLLALGVAGVLLAVFEVGEAFAEISAGHLFRGFGWLVFGVLFGAAAVHVLKIWRTRSDTKL